MLENVKQWNFVHSIKVCVPCLMVFYNWDFLGSISGILTVRYLFNDKKNQDLTVKKSGAQSTIETLLLQMSQFKWKSCCIVRDSLDWYKLGCEWKENHQHCRIGLNSIVHGCFFALVHTKGHKLVVEWKPVLVLFSWTEPVDHWRFLTLTTWSVFSMISTSSSLSSACVVKGELLDCRGKSRWLFTKQACIQKSLSIKGAAIYWIRSFVFAIKDELSILY